MGRWAIINGLLAIMVALLGLEIARTWGRALPVVEVTARPGTPDEPREKGGKRGGDKGAARAQQTPAVLVAAIADKDLFDPARRPPSEDAAAPPVAPVTGPPTNLTVSGIRISGKNREVFVTDSSQGNRQQRLHVGDQVAAVVQGQPGTVNYTIKEIEAAGLTLASPAGDTLTLALELDKSKALALQRPAVPPRPGQPVAAPASPAAGGMLGASPAAGVQVRPPAAPVPGAPVPPGRQPLAPPGVPTPGVAGYPQGVQLPPEVRQKLEAHGSEQAGGAGRPGRKHQ